ncbi:MAG: ABC transporter substrate-binding protein [Patescibacteria group bacterium]
MDIQTHGISSTDSPTRNVWGNSTFLERVLLLCLSAIVVVSGYIFFSHLTTRLTLEQPSRGGSFTEGIVGTPRFINPLLAQSQADQDLSILLFSGLMRALPDGTLVPDLARDFTVSEDGTQYTFMLDRDAVFHDGTAITADDVVFTITRAHDPALQSPQEDVWTGIGVEALNERTVTFTLSRAYASFLENLTIGILPAHLWESTPPEEFSAHILNTEPVGSGPYKLASVKRNTSGIPTSYILSAFNDSTRGRPHINEIIIRIFGNEKDVLSAFLDNDIDSLDGLDPIDAKTLTDNGALVSQYDLPRVFGLFFNQNKNDTLTSISVRRALNAAIDKEVIVEEVLNGFGEALYSPLPTNLFAASTTNVTNHTEEARGILERAGFVLNEETGFFEDDDIPLSVHIATANSPELRTVADMVKDAWEKAGIETTVELFDIGQLHHEVIRPRSYDVLLFGEVVGRDGDLYPFWHSSQRNDPGLNVALYASITADAILEDIRATLDSATREELYTSFVDEIESDVPAVFLYMPHLLYVAPKNVSGMTIGVVHTGAERFLDVHEWYVRTERVWKFLSH